MGRQLQRLYEFGPYELDTAERTLLRNGERVALTPKAFETLVLLIERRGQLVEKEELMKALWPDSFVEEANLTNNVWTVRKTLGEGHNGQVYIETVPRRGYRFTASVKERSSLGDKVVLEKHTLTRIVTETHAENETDIVGEHEPPSLPSPRLGRMKGEKAAVVAGLCLLLVAAGVLALYRPWRARQAAKSEAGAASPSPLRSIAVLPFKTIGAESQDEYLGLGMSDALITRLGNVHQIIVRPTSAVRKYTGAQDDPVAAGREQGVEAVLDGSIQRVGDRLRVTVQLFRAQDGASLWSAKFDERFTDIFAVQDSISQQVMRGLMVELNPEERRRLLQQRGSENIEAYQAYLKGFYFWNKRTKDGYQKAVEFFNQAIEKDPTYALAYVGLGHAYAYLGGQDRASESEAIARQRAAAKRALELDETLSEAHAALGLIAMNSDWDWPQADREFKRAIELNPNDATAHAWYGEYLTFMGRFDEGVAEIKRGQELDPLSLVINTDVAKVYMLARRYDEAIAQYKRALEMDPEFGVAHGLMALTYSQKGMHEEALGEMRRIRDLEKEPMYLSFLGYVEGRAGKKDEARGVLKRMERLSQQTYVSPLWMTIIYAGLSEKDEAFKWFERVIDERATGGTIALKASPVYDSLRSDPRFADLLRRAGFAP